MAYEQHDDALTWEFRARKALKGRRDAEKLLDVCTEQPPVPEPQPLVDVSVEPWVGVLAIVGAIGAGVVLGVAL